jgi:putative colanic acid biosynthesis acetyltransferase WcaF
VETAVVVLCWITLSTELFASHVSFQGLDTRLFGAKIGQGVRIKPGVRVKFPWRLIVGDYVWIGEDAWLDNIAPITIESHVCLSQGVYLCTGNHNWVHPDFKLIPAPIHIQESSWIAAKSVIGPGVTVGWGAVLTLGGVLGVP